MHQGYIWKFPWSGGRRRLLKKDKTREKKYSGPLLFQKVIERRTVSGSVWFDCGIYVNKETNDVMLPSQYATLWNS